MWLGNADIFEDRILGFKKTTSDSIKFSIDLGTEMGLTGLWLSFRFVITINIQTRKFLPIIWCISILDDDNKQCINVFDILLPQGINVHYETKINITVFSNNN